MSKAGLITKWAFFGVILALIPLISGVLMVRTQGPLKEPLMQLVCSRGELILVCAGIAGAAIGDLIGAGNKLLVPKLVAGGSCVLMMILGAIWYGVIVADIAANRPVDASFVTGGSLPIFIITLLAAGSCVVLAEA
jgi:hypothetical protein